jgi:hypothetical protein
MKFKNLDKMRLLSPTELGKLKGGDCSSCSQSCLKACSPGRKSGDTTIEPTIPIDGGGTN